MTKVDWWLKSIDDKSWLIKLVWLTDRQTDKRTDNANSRVAFATEKKVVTWWKFQQSLLTDWLTE